MIAINTSTAKNKLEQNREKVTYNTKKKKELKSNPAVTNML